MSTELPRRFSMKRIVTFVATIVAAAGFAGASEAHVARETSGRAADVHLTYTMRFTPSFPDMVGVVGGDVPGRFGGAILQLSPPDLSQRILHFTSVYIVVAANPSKSFAARVHGTQDNATESTCRVGRCTGRTTGVLDGHVVDGWMRGKRVHAEYTVVSCTDAPDEMCFTGAITIRRGRSAKTLGLPAATRHPRNGRSPR